LNLRREKFLVCYRGTTRLYRRRDANLAAPVFLASQEQFVQSVACSDDTDFLLTFVRADYQASMIRALRDKGWTCTGWSKPSQAANRPDTQIRDRYKWRFLCPVDHIHTQAGLSEWTDAG
jgi:hypothetical protein